jgi:hypothetical protein
MTSLGWTNIVKRDAKIVSMSLIYNIFGGSNFILTVFHTFRCVILSTVCTANVVGFWRLRSIQPASPLLTPGWYELSLPETIIRADAPINFDIVLPEVVIKSASVKNA